ncbi:YigZ family protein [Flavipsychrobacter stenotrophus]|uniref:YigZ family protein n=1 Tax=Flavipsychrobacter stenotrophus TaxID=2077091 RepID=A0A2S7SVP9_9BACT|nr:YigZ family protein [Flavipsychrobacter stenotrophus]PQJ10983.1 YigZ family protein [Flavipsychrobacter stenotrophus]
MTPDKYTTISTPGTGDFRDRGSKFLAFSYPVFTQQEIKDKLQMLKKLHPKANHHCVAWRLGTDGSQYRATDDGEPSGSAGKPMLGQIDSLGLTNVLVVVVRYFGGSLLGVPGLINAYKTATALSLENLPRVEKWIEGLYELNFDYPSMGEVLYLLKQCEATIYQQDLQLFCTIKAGIPRPQITTYVAKLEEIRGVTVKPQS